VSSIHWVSVFQTNKDLLTLLIYAVYSRAGFPGIPLKRIGDSTIINVTVDNLLICRRFH